MTFFALDPDCDFLNILIWFWEVVFLYSVFFSINFPVMWIRIDCIRIRSQVNNITELISNHMLRWEKQFFSNLYLILTRLATFLGSDLKGFIPQDPDPGPPWMRIRPDPDHCNFQRQVDKINKEIKWKRIHISQKSWTDHDFYHHNPQHFITIRFLMTYSYS